MAAGSGKRRGPRRRTNYDNRVRCAPPTAYAAELLLLLDEVPDPEAFEPDAFEPDVFESDDFESEDEDVEDAEDEEEESEDADDFEDEAGALLDEELRLSLR